MSNDTTLGQLLTNDENKQRDAIHIAVAPVKAAMNLSPGEHIGFTDTTCINVGTSIIIQRESIGIVDPFLKEVVKEGEWFYMLLYPKTITSLKHLWEHPAFKENPEYKYVGTTTGRISSSSKDDKQKSEAWLKQYVIDHCPYWNESSDGYKQFLDYVKTDKTIFYYGTDCHNYEEVENADELFKHLSVVLDMNINKEYFKYFSCSC